MAGAIEREVSATPEEFAHGLRLAFGEAVSGGPLRFHVAQDAVCLEIELVVGPDRVIAALHLPSLRASLRFTSGNPSAQAKLLARMDMAMQRGGG